MAAHYAEMAYKENLAARRVRGSGFIYAAKYESWASATMFWLDTDKNYLIFRGTSDPSDILLDIWWRIACYPNLVAKSYSKILSRKIYS